MGMKWGKFDGDGAGWGQFNLPYQSLVPLAEITRQSSRTCKVSCP